MSNRNTFALLPLDNRPVSYLLPKQIADFSSINLVLPERKHLGDLNKGADLNYIQEWLQNINNTDGLIISLDTWIYGGLVQSRKHSFSLEELKARANSFHLPSTFSHLPKYGFSSILRIPNYNSSEEEKDYWQDYGEKIFKWSELMHKVGKGIQDCETSNEELIDKWYQSTKEIPPEILANYKALRDKNLTINMLWLESLHEDLFNYLIFSCDDSAKYGMNIVEAEYLKKKINTHQFTNKANVISGTDEIPLLLLTKAILDTARTKPSVALYFNSQKGKDEIARYESMSIYDSVKSKIKLLGLEIKDPQNADMMAVVHSSDLVQGDHAFSINSIDTQKNTAELISKLKEINKPFILIDLAYANGSDPNLIDTLLKSKINLDNLYGYSAWNTCSNSTGSALAIGINRWIAEKNSSFNKESFKKCLLTRFLDDYAYQAKIRHKKLTEEKLSKEMEPYINEFSTFLGIKPNLITCTLPWKRSFEIEIKL